jgi:hypothetical protein
MALLACQLSCKTPQNGEKEAGLASWVTPRISKVGNSDLLGRIFGLTPGWVGSRIPAAGRGSFVRWLVLQALPGLHAGHG